MGEGLNKLIRANREASLLAARLGAIADLDRVSGRKPTDNPDADLERRVERVLAKMVNRSQGT